MKLIIRTVTYPITFLIDLSIRLCALGIGIASALFGWISGLIALGAAIVTLTGDLGKMDDQGFVYFKGRAKRMIVTSGYNVYPAQIENILDAHEMVQMSCVIGVPDSYKMQKVKAFVKLSAGVEPSEETKQAILAHCRKYVAKYAMPYDIAFKDEMPKTLVGKVAYRVLEEEELAKLQGEACSNGAGHV